jgi:hypothetical protein
LARMSFVSIVWLSLQSVALAAGAPQQPSQAHDHSDHGGGLGTVNFTVSCSPEAQVLFNKGVAQLHSFWYSEAEKTFGQVAAADPSCGMAHWGVAITQVHPVWAAGNPSQAPLPAELEKGKAAVEAAKAGVKTDRERAFVTAVDAYYAGSDPHDVRAKRFAEAMGKVAAAYPQDVEASIFHALTLLGVASADDKTYATQKQAADILNRVLPSTPDHPGVAHYLIHSFDYPELARLALPAARTYAKIAPASPHAQHMPSHIFTRLALWEESVKSNMDSADSARRHVAVVKPGATSFEALHALDYMAYAYLQQGKDQMARGVLDEVRRTGEVHVPNFAAAYALAAVPARYALERRAWSEAAALEPAPASFPWAKFPHAEAIVQFARGVGGARGGNLPVARAALQRLNAIQQDRAAAKDDYYAKQADIQRQAVTAWLALAEGRRDDARKLMTAAADLEATTEKSPVTPGQVLPAREQLGDLLLEIGEPAQALTAYETSLATVPGRFASVLGAATASQKLGDASRTRDWYKQLVTLTKGSTERPAIQEARAYLRAKPSK